MKGKNFVKRFTATVIAVTISLLFTAGSAVSDEREFRVVGSWSNLTMYKQYGGPQCQDSSPSQFEYKCTA